MQTDNRPDAVPAITHSAAPSRPGELNHGEIPNLGVRGTSNGMVLFTTDNAISTDDLWIEWPRASFYAECDFVAVDCIQVVAHGLRDNALGWYSPVSKPVVYAVHHFERASETSDASEARANRHACIIDDVTSMYRCSF